MTYPSCALSDRPQHLLKRKNRDQCFDKLLDALPACVSYVDADLRYRFANATYEDWFQLERQAICGRYLWDVIGHEAYQTAKPYIDGVLAGRQITYETVLPYAQGHRDIRGTLTPDINEHAQVQGFYALIVDISDDRHTEMQLRRSEAALAKAQEIAHIGNWEFDVATQRFNCSAEMLRLLGLAATATPPSLSQMAQFFPADDWAQVKQTAQQLLTTGEPQPFSGHIVRSDGEWRYLKGDSEAIKNDRGAVVRLLGTAMDVTEQQQRIDQLRLLEAVILNANDAVLITEAAPIDPPGPRILYVNPAFTQMTGYTSGEVIGQTPRILQGNKTDRASLDQIRTALRTNQKTRVELLNYRKDGSEFWVEMELVPITDAKGQVTHFVAFQRDVSDRKYREQKLEEQAALIDIATDAFLVRDLNSRLLFWSRGAEQIYGWRAAEVLGQNVDQLLNAESKQSPQVQAAWQTVLRQGEWQGEIVKQTKVGKIRTVESRWTLVRDAIGNPTAVLSVDTDITERQQLEAQFLRAQRLESLGTLASGIAHDLNNILTPILGIAQLLPHKLPEAEPLILELIDIVAKSAKRGASLSKQILSFAKGAGGDFTALSLRHLLAEIRRFAQQTFPKSIAISVEVSPNLWMIRGDATHLYQVLMNLCVNAKDAMPEGGQLSLTAHNLELSEDHRQSNSYRGLDGNFYVVIEVTDTGIGIPPDQIDKIFDPFFTTKEPGQGTGLGLSTVAGIIQSHGGQMQVTSQVNQGTRFTISLPAAPITAPLSEEFTSLFTGSGELILVVDDEPQIRYVTQALLESHSYKVLTACDGEEAIALYQEQADDINAVLMDFRMPKMSGAIALGALRQINPQLKVIMTSGVVSMTELSERDSLTVDAFLPKPYDVETLLKALSTVLHS
ncbi:MAG: PAS domain S-box protein [Leptolyngbyaceae cyanobacterium]